MFIPSVRVSYTIYRSLQILNQCLKFCFCGVMFPWMNFFFIIIPVITNTFTIQHNRDLTPIALFSGIIISLSLIVGLLLIYPKAAAINTLSGAYLKSLFMNCGLKGSEPVTKKHVKACFPLKIKYGTFGFIQKITTLKMIGLIFYWTMRALLLNRK